MGGYILGALTVGFVTAVGTHLAHRSTEQAARLAMGLILLSAIVAPLIGLKEGIQSITLPELDGIGDITDAEYADTAKEAFCLGIALTIAERYSVDQGSVKVMCDGFDFESMSALRVYVTLGEGARGIDYRAVKEYVLKNINAKECEVEIEIVG